MTSIKENLRKKRHQKIRSTISGSSHKPRLCIYRSNSAIYAQLIDDTEGKVIASASSMKMKESGVVAAKKVGEEIAKLAKKSKIETCVFDRGGYLYHGKVKAVAEGAREGGLKF